jgi:hypothetical protein
MEIDAITRHVTWASYLSCLSLSFLVCKLGSVRRLNKDQEHFIHVTNEELNICKLLLLILFII